LFLDACSTLQKCLSSGKSLTGHCNNGWLTHKEFTRCIIRPKRLAPYIFNIHLMLAPSLEGSV
jgi:hypothetical protein